MLEGRNVTDLAVTAIGATSGFVIAQEVADRVLPVLGMNVDPSSGSELGASVIVKTVTAVGLGAAAGATSGLPLIALAFAAVGSLGNAGADLLDMAQRFGLPGLSPTMHTAGAATTATRQATAQAGGSGNARAPGSSGHYR